MSRQHSKLNRKKWAVVRKKALERDGHRCVLCTKAGRLEVDHIIQLRDGGKPYDLDNLRTLCRHCHILETSKSRPDPVEGKTDWINYLSSFQD